MTFIHSPISVTVNKIDKSNSTTTYLPFHYTYRLAVLVQKAKY